MTIPKYHLAEVFDPAKSQPDDAHSILMRLIPHGSRVLELGCASGYLSGYMEQGLGCRVTGLEYDSGSVEIARTRCSEVHQADLDDDSALNAARTSAPYDVLLAAAVLEHLKYPERLLRQAAGLLQPGARLIVSLPNIAHWQMRLTLLMGRFDYQDYGIMDRTHLKLYTHKTGRELIESCGYAIDEIQIAGSALQNLLNSFARLARRGLPQPLLPGLLAYELIYTAHYSIR